MRSISVMRRPDSGLPDAERPSRQTGRAKTGNSAIPRDCIIPDPFCNGEFAEFLALFNSLDDANRALLSHLDEVVASLRGPGAQPLIDAITRQAESLRNRMSLMARLARELKENSD